MQKNFKRQRKLFCIPKILKNESNSQQNFTIYKGDDGCFVSQRYWKMKAIHNYSKSTGKDSIVVLYPKDTEKWKQFTTYTSTMQTNKRLFCIPKILKNESNSQLKSSSETSWLSCFVSQRYWKMKAIHNIRRWWFGFIYVVLYPKDTEKWKQFTTEDFKNLNFGELFCIPKILKNESNSQLCKIKRPSIERCFVSQRYWKMKAIHNRFHFRRCLPWVVLYPKDTEKWKQFTTDHTVVARHAELFCIPKILKNESNSQPLRCSLIRALCCFVSQRYWKMKAIHNWERKRKNLPTVVLYPKDTEKWKQFTTTKSIRLI